MSASPDSVVAFSDWISDLSPHGILTTDRHLVVNGWNHWLVDHTQQPASTVVGHSLFDLYPDLEKRQLDLAYKQAIEGRTVVLSQRLHCYLLPMPVAAEYESQFNQMQQSAQISPIRQNGEVVGTITIITDVTERVAREQELHQLLVQERVARTEVERAVGRVERLLELTAALSRAVTALEIAEVVVGQGGRAAGAYAGLMALINSDNSALGIVHANGYPHSIIEQWNLIPLEIPSPLTEAALTGIAVFIESRQVFAMRYPLLTSLLNESGSQAFAAIPLAVYDRVIGVLGLSFASEQAFSSEERSFMLALAQQGAQALERARLYEAEHQARANAEAAVHIRDQFLSIAAHEFRTPLAAMLGNAQLLKRRMLKDGGLSEQNQHLLHITIHQGFRLSRMVSTMLDVSRLEMGRFTLDKRPLDLDQLLQRIIEEIQTVSTNHTISYTSLNQPMLIEGDEQRLEQVFHNLLSNAMKYSPAGGSVTVQVALENSFVQVMIQDQGIGIPTEAIPQLFQQFFRASNVVGHKISGVGIGLFIVKEIVSRHGGTITVTSQEGQGSTFTLSLPRLPQPQD